MNTFRQLIHEAHRRSLWQVLGLYAVSGWVVYQVVLGLYEGIGLPDWVPATAIVLLLVGLPIVLATAFVQEGGPGQAGGPAEVGGPALTDAPAGTPAPDRRVEGAPTPPLADGPPSFFTWSRAITAGILAFAALGLAASGFMGMRALGVGPAATLMSRGVIEAGDPIILADFENGTDEEQLGAIVTDALRVDLLGSPVIELVEPRAVQRTLRRMRREGAERVDPELALEVAVRDGYRAVISGEIAQVGGGYLLTAEVVAPEGGTLLAFREAAANAGDLLPAIDRLSEAIRGKIGESLKSARSGQPLAEVTTASLDALRTYSQALRLADREGEFLRAVRLLEEAVEMDPAFAMAYRKIAVLWSNMGVNDQGQVEAAARAYEHRDRLNDRERAHAVAQYHSDVTGDQAAVVDAYENLLARYPYDPVATNNLAMTYNLREEYAKAEAALSAPRERGSLQPTQYVNLINAVWGQGRTAEVSSLLSEFRAAYPDNPSVEFRAAEVAAGMGQREEADSILRAMLARFSGSALVQGQTQLMRARLAEQRGQVQNASELRVGVARAAAQLDMTSAVALILAEGAQVAARTTGVDRVDRHIRTLETMQPPDSLPPLNRPYHHLAEAYLWTDRPNEASALLDALEAAVPEEHERVLGAHHGILRGWVRVARGEHDAVPEMRRVLETHPCELCVLDIVGYVSEMSGEQREAIELYERYLSSRRLARTGIDAQARGFVLQRLAALYEERGDGAMAARYYSDFVDLWADADPALQPRVEAARRALARIAAEG